RLGVTVDGVAAAQSDVEEQVTGPSVKVGFNNGQPTPAAQAFAKKVNVDVNRLERITTPKGEYLAAKVTNRGRGAGELLAEGRPREMGWIYWPKSMYWRQKNERFVRPVRWLVALLDGEVMRLEFAGVSAGSDSQGHRTLGSAVRIASPRSYEADLLRAAV